jgi:hypothetical protein
MFDREQQSILDIKPSLLTLPAAAPRTKFRLQLLTWGFIGYEIEFVFKRFLFVA